MNGKNFVVCHLLYQNMLSLHQVNKKLLLFFHLFNFFLGASTLYLCGGDFPNGMCFFVFEKSFNLNDE
jgi:hypothetical protein